MRQPQSRFLAGTLASAAIVLLVGPLACNSSSENANTAAQNADTAAQNANIAAKSAQETSTATTKSAAEATKASTAAAKSATDAAQSVTKVETLATDVGKSAAEAKTSASQAAQSVPDAKAQVKKATEAANRAEKAANRAEKAAKTTVNTGGNLDQVTIAYTEGLLDGILDRLKKEGWNITDIQGGKIIATRRSDIPDDRCPCCGERIGGDYMCRPAKCQPVGRWGPVCPPLAASTALEPPIEYRANSMDYLPSK